MRRILWLLVAGVALGLPSAAAADRPVLPFGRLIVKGWQQAWLVPAQGRTVHLPGAEAVDWSPALRLLAVTERARLAGRWQDGTTLWSRRYARLAGAPRWSSGSPVRLAFLAGRAVRVVDAHGLKERRLGPARDVAPAWRPGRDELAFVTPDGDVVLMSGAGRLLARWRAWRAPAGLSWTGVARAYVLLGRIVWSPDARFVLVERPLLRGWMLLDVRTGRARHIELPRALRLVSGGVVAWIR